MWWIILIVVIVLVVVFCYKKSESKNSHNPHNKGGNNSGSSISSQSKFMDTAHNTSDDSKKHYWLTFKLSNPSEAGAIEWLLDKDMSACSDKDAFEIVNSVLRWSENAKVPIHQLKVNFFKVFSNILSEEGGSIEETIDFLKSKRIEEARTFHISIENTIYHFMMNFLKEAHKYEDVKDIAEDIESKALEIFEIIIPESKRAEVNQDTALFFTDMVVDMLKSSKIDDRIKQSLPDVVNNKMQDLISFCESNNISKKDFAKFLEVAQSKFITKFDK